MAVILGLGDSATNLGGMSYDDITSRRARYTTIAAAMKLDRTSFDAPWQELADYFNPRRVRFQTSGKNRGGRLDQRIINSSGRFAARTLQSGLHAGLTSPARPWMKLTVPDQDLAKFKPVAEWLRTVTDRMLTMFSVSNLYNVLPIVYGDMGVFGTALMAVLEDSRDLFRCQAYPVGSYWLGQDSRGRVTSVLREYSLSVRQVVEQFGLKANRRDIDWARISESTKKLWENGQYEAEVNVTWLVKPNEMMRNDRLEAKYLPWSSCHWEDSVEKGFLLESGYRSFPFMAPRWDITGEDTYGTDCPGMIAIGDNKQLQLMEKKKAQAIQKMVDPPMVGPSSLRAQKTSILSGDITYVDSREGMQGFKPAHEVNFRIDHLVQDMARIEYRINQAFYADLFLMLSSADQFRGAQPPTAREIDERHEEKMLALGPVLERTNDELLDPIVDRMFSMMVTAGFFKPEALPPPPELEGVDLKVEYVSILAQAQKLVGVSGLDRFTQTVTAIAAISPGVLDKVDFNQVVDDYGDMTGIDPRVVRSNEAADAIGAQRAKQQQGQAMAEQAALLGKGAKDLSETKLGTDSALDRISAGVAAQNAAQGGAPA